MSELALAGARTPEEANALLPEIIKRINKCLSHRNEENNVHKTLPKNNNYKLMFIRYVIHKLSKPMYVKLNTLFN